MKNISKKVVSKAEYKRRAAKAVVTKILNKVTQNNKIFAKLPKKEKAVLVAKDIIAQIKVKKFLPKHQGYVAQTFLQVDEEEDAQKELLTNKSLKCTVCALGACALSIARLGNSLSIADLVAMDNTWSDNADPVKESLVSVFDPIALYYIEKAYETGSSTPLSEDILDNYYHIDKWDIDDSNAINFGNKYPNSEKRLIAIMENVIANNGVFVP